MGKEQYYKVYLDDKKTYDEIVKSIQKNFVDYAFERLARITGVANQDLEGILAYDDKKLTIIVMVAKRANVPKSTKMQLLENFVNPLDEEENVEKIDVSNQLPNPN